MRSRDLHLTISGGQSSVPVFLRFSDTSFSPMSRHPHGLTMAIMSAASEPRPRTLSKISDRQDFMMSRCRPEIPDFDDDFDDYIKSNMPYDTLLIGATRAFEHATAVATRDTATGSRGCSWYKGRQEIRRELERCNQRVRPTHPCADYWYQAREMWLPIG